jgi:molybdopterin synthase sulfur carrier subunit
MTVRVRLPVSMQGPAAGADELCVPAAGSVSELVEDLELRFPGVKSRLCDERGDIRRFIAVFVNGTDIRALAGEATTLDDGDEVLFILAVAGG